MKKKMILSASDSVKSDQFDNEIKEASKKFPKTIQNKNWDKNMQETFLNSKNIVQQSNVPVQQFDQFNTINHFDSFS